MHCSVYRKDEFMKRIIVFVFTIIALLLIYACATDTEEIQIPSASSSSDICSVSSSKGLEGSSIADTPVPSLEPESSQIIETSSMTPSLSTSKDENLPAVSAPSKRFPSHPPALDEEKDITSTPSSTSEQLPETPFPPESVTATEISEPTTPFPSDSVEPEISIPTESSASPDVSAPAVPTISLPPETTSQPEPDMEAEYARIIRETVAYAEGCTAKGFTFIWDDSLEFSWESGAGWMGTPRVKHEGVDGTIEMLKYHIDKIVQTSTDSGNGVPAHSAHYKVMQVTVDGDTAFVVLYG